MCIHTPFSVILGVHRFVWNSTGGILAWLWTGYLLRNVVGFPRKAKS